eukprot:Lankesteria_metandrocarpae@DN3694_c0_g1_i1.p1
MSDLLSDVRKAKRKRIGVLQTDEGNSVISRKTTKRRLLADSDGDSTALHTAGTARSGKSAKNRIKTQALPDAEAEQLEKFVFGTLTLTTARPSAERGDTDSHCVHDDGAGNNTNAAAVSDCKGAKKTSDGSRALARPLRLGSAVAAEEEIVVDSREAEGDWLELASRRRRARVQEQGGLKSDLDVPYDAWEDTASAVNPLLGSSAKVIERGGAYGGGGAHHAARIKWKRMLPLNISSVHKSTVACVEFHPNGSLALTAGRDKTVKLYSLRLPQSKNSATTDNHTTALLESLHFGGRPVRSATFINPEKSAALILASNKQLVEYDIAAQRVVKIPPFMSRGSICTSRFASRDKQFGINQYKFIFSGPLRNDCPTLKSTNMFGLTTNEGLVMLCDCTSKKIVSTLKLNTRVAGAAFHPRCDAVVCADTEGTLYTWDLTTGTCRQRFQDPRATSVTAFGVSVAAGGPHADVAGSDATRNGGMMRCGALAVGTPSGFVDLFELTKDSIREDIVMSYKNLKTPVGQIKFHPRGDIFGFSTSGPQNGIKLAHLGSRLVYQNFPDKSLDLGRVTAFDFCRTGGLLGVGSEAGLVNLFRLVDFK